jgi:transposase
VTASGTSAPSKPGAPIPGAKKPDGRKKRTSPPTGRRGEELANLPKIYVPIIDPELEGKVEKIGVVESYKLGRERGGARCLVLEIAVYKKPADAPVLVAVPAAPAVATSAASEIVTAPPSAACSVPTALCSRDAAEAPIATSCAAPIAKLAKTLGPRMCIVRAPRPLEIVRRGMLAPTMIAHLLAQKYLMGLPFHRLEQQFAREGFPLDRGTMGRYAEDIGAVLGFIVEAAREEAIATAFCLSTDATGVSIQPTPLDDGRHQPCRKGHFFVTLADRDHVFFDYQAKHNSLAVWEMFKGFKGYIQADAHVIYDAVFRGTPPEGAEETAEEAVKRGPPPIEVACWSHAGRHM